MRRILVAVLGAVTALAAAAPALAHPRVDVGPPTMPTDVTFAATDNIEYHGRFPEHSGTAGGRLVADLDRFYLTDPRGVYVYDTSEPTSPDLLGSLALPQSGLGVALAQEDPDTDGEILLVDATDPDSGSDEAMLRVVDVSDPASLEVIGSADVTDHTWTCVTAGDNACAYAYGRSGHIVDLTDPTQPEHLDDTWRAAVGYGDSGNSPYAHDLTEIRPGLVMSAGSTNILMDTTDPTSPVHLTEVWTPGRFSSLGYHSVEWANGGDDPIAIFGTEIAPSGTTNLAGSDCEGDNSVIETWDASEVAAELDLLAAGEITAEQFTAEFTNIDAFDAGGRGIFLEGQAPGHVLYCAHWMEPAPDFDGGGRMVVSYYDRGTRFVDVAPDGTMEEIGWITAAEGYSGSSQWISHDVVYIMDYRRGMEVVQLHDEEATGTYENTTDVVAASSRVEAAAVAPAHGSDIAVSVAAVALGLLLLAVDRRRRRLRTSG